MCVSYECVFTKKSMIKISIVKYTYKSEIINITSCVILLIQKASQDILSFVKLLCKKE